MICRASVPLLLALLVTASPALLAKDEKPAGNFVQQALQKVQLGPGRRSAQLVVFPLLATESPEALDVQPDIGAPDIAYEEPEWARRRYDLFVGNGGKRTVLLYGGSVLHGGLTDRLLGTDVLLPPGGEIEVPTLPAEARSERRKEPLPFRHTASLAPNYLREQALFEPTTERVRTFISHFEEFFNEDDTRRSLAAIDDSVLLQRYCLACQQAMAEFPQLGGSRVVGYVSAVRGRIHALELFGTNELLKAYFEPGLRAHTYVAAAIALRAEKAGIPLPDEEADKLMLALQVEAESLLARLKTARFRSGDVPKGAVGESLLVRAGGARGAAVGLDGRLVHLTLFPHDPFESALFSRDLRLPPPEQETSGGGPGVPELERGTDPGRRLTEYERRLLDRMRRSRGDAGGARPPIR